MPSPASSGVVSTQAPLMATCVFWQVVEPAFYNGVKKEVSKMYNHSRLDSGVHVCRS